MATIERNIKHECAEYAYRCVEEIKKNHSNIKDKYLSEVMSTGTRISGSGLMQTLAFYLSKEEPHFKKLTLHILKWVLKDIPVNGQTLDLSIWDEDKKETFKIFSFLLNKPDEEMIYCTERALDVTQWLSRFARAMLKG